MPVFHKLRVQDIRKETPDTVSIAFEVPESLQDRFRFQNGQYITLKVDVGGEVRRSYSLSSCLTTDEEHRIAVKEVENGRVSRFLNQELTVGDTLEVSEPEGRFCPDLRPENALNYTLFAAGSGITPILSIIKGVLTTEPNSQIVLFYQNRNESSVIFEEVLRELAEKHSAFTWHAVYSQPEGQHEELYSGRIDPRKAVALLRAHGNLSVEGKYFLCGPEGFMKGVQQALETLRVDPDTVHVEYFSTPDAAPIESTSGRADGPVPAKVILDDETFEMTIKPGATVLDAALAADIDAPYSCRGGVCSTCMAQVEEGHATMRLNYTLTDEEVEEGFILTCQAVPDSPTIQVNYDA